MRDEAIPALVQAAGPVAIHAYAAFLERGEWTRETRAAYAVHIRRFLGWAECRGLTLETIGGLEWTEHAKGLPPAQARLRLSVLRRLMEHLVAGGALPSNPFPPPARRGPRGPALALKLDEVLRMTDAEAERVFRRIRWPDTGGLPVCHRCRGIDHYTCKAEPRWKCKGCGYRFSVTSGTLFASRKLPLRDILAAMAILKSGAEKPSALRLSRDLSVQYRTACALARKIRGAVRNHANRRRLGEEWEIDIACRDGRVDGGSSDAYRRDRRIHQSNGTGSGAAMQAPGPSVPLEKLKKIVREIGAAGAWTEDDEDFEAGLVMLAAISIDSRSPAALSAFTGVAKPSVRAYARRLVENGIWLPDGEIGADWSDPQNGNLNFMMDVWVALGQLERSTTEDGREMPDDLARTPEATDAR